MSCPDVHTVASWSSAPAATSQWNDRRDVWYHELSTSGKTECEPEPMDAEDPLFILYTSGSTGKPKGVLHTTGGYQVYAAMTHKYVFDYHDGEVYWCTADVGWVTGHSYIVYGPLANGATTLMFEGVPTYPRTRAASGRSCDKHQVEHLLHRTDRDPGADGPGATSWSRAPAALSSLQAARHGGRADQSRKPGSGTTDVVGDGIAVPIVDTWWQTETGGILITPLPGATPLKPGSATRPFFGVVPEIVDGDGNVLEGACEGNLCIRQPWPGQMRTVYGDHERFVQTYFSHVQGQVLHRRRRARRDEDGYYWITGRVDDVINVSGHRMGTAEVESALVLHEAVAEAAVVGYPHDIKGQGIYAYVTLMAGVDGTDELRKDLVATGAQGDRTDRVARRHPVGARSAEDPLGQDHATHPAQGRGERARHARRHVHARRAGGRRRPDRQPRQPVTSARPTDAEAGRSGASLDAFLERVPESEREPLRAAIEQWQCAMWLAARHVEPAGVGPADVASAPILRVYGDLVSTLAGGSVGATLEDEEQIAVARALGEVAGTLARLAVEATRAVPARVSQPMAPGAVARTLYDRYVEEWERRYREWMLSDAFSRLQGELCNAALRVRRARAREQLE